MIFVVREEMKMFISSHLKIIFLMTISSLCYPQNRPVWFDETGVYRNWIARENVSQFDSKIRTSGIPAWGSWFILTNGEQGLQEEVAYHHAMGKFYIPSITFRSIGRADNVYYSIDSIAARDV